MSEQAFSRPSLTCPQSTLTSTAMDLSDLANKLGFARSDSKRLVRKAAELRRLADIQFNSSVIGVGETCKAIICLEIAATSAQVIFDRKTAIRMSGMSEKAYNRSLIAMQNGLGVKNKLDIRELGIQFGCIRLIPLVQKALSLYRDRFLAALPASRRASADCTRPVFTAAAFYLCAKKQKLKVDKIKLIELCGTSEDEFNSVSTSMKDLCFDQFGITKEKSDPKKVKGNRDLLDELPEKRRIEDGGYLSDDEDEPSLYKKRKRMDEHAYKEWKSTVMESNNKNKETVPEKRTKQAQLNFPKLVPETKVGAV